MDARWGRTSPIAMATGDSGPSLMVIGNRPLVNIFNAQTDDYDGLVISKSRTSNSHLEYFHSKVSKGNAFNISDKLQGQDIDRKRMIKICPEEDKMIESERWFQPVQVQQQPELNQHFDLGEKLLSKTQVKKKEILLPESRDLSHKAAQKRCASEDQWKEEMFEGIQTINLRQTDREQAHELIESINLKQQTEAKCISFDQQKFSTFENLIEEKEAKNSGSFGEVCKVKDSLTCSSLIRKKIKDKIEANEVEVPIQFLHKPNLCAVLGLYFDCKDTYVIQEDAGYSLRQLGSNLDFRKKLLQQPDMTVKIVFDIFQGLAILETHNIVHCDIKPENVCLKFNSDGSHTAKIIDFGSCKTPKDKMNYIGLTPEYLPPSINQFLCLAMQKKLTQSTVHPRLTVKDDVWGAGMVTLYIEKGEHPVIKHFTGQQDYPRDQKGMTLRVEVMKKTAELRNPLPTYFNTNKPVLDYLLANVLSVDPNLRWTSSAAVTFLKAKLNPEPKLKRQKQEVLNQPKFEHNLIKRDNSIEDVDLKACKGVHLPFSASSPREEELLFGNTFGAAFRLKQEFQSTPAHQSNVQKRQYDPDMTQNVLAPQPLFHQASTHNLTSKSFPQRKQPFIETNPFQQVTFFPMSQKQVSNPQKMLASTFHPVCPQSRKQVLSAEEDMEYEDLVQSFFNSDDQVIDRKQPHSYRVSHVLGGATFQKLETPALGVAEQKLETPAVAEQNNFLTELGNIPDMVALLEEEGGRIKIKGRRRSNKKE
ncbi:probable serine/threonine-protein kinase dyrk1 [Biomphalaria glabrata]|uniref:Probable serine/threonine-protein kinase dyrk1 n=1 Tax=Biomphalaria glabrata TaxID=6526 RepID=A0A9W2Z7Q0_BIOGL|nr:probable serine/threonine-protein kinase dyrk1 [Biomphalaria glabrata]XP_055870933.1 probable serine/threonine-protein kinase dyrk1 [Biomphalaria glabrata]